jgi:acetyl/propionyl-CoA carboxylase alpha subunit/acetyl-CoA carboxylase carboxyltransferase component
MLDVDSIKAAISRLHELNPRYLAKNPEKRFGGLQKVLVANRGEIAKRFFHSLKEEGIPSVAIVTNPDLGQSWYAMADEALFIGDAMNYMDIPTVIAAAAFVKANAIYPGYGFLSENHVFVDALGEYAAASGNEIIFMGPSAEIMRGVGNKLNARALAAKNGIPLFQSSDALQNAGEAIEAAEKIGYPVIVKLNAGGGGKGMKPVFSPADVAGAVDTCQRVGRQINGDDIFYLERYIVHAIHMEVQIFNGMAIGIRKCAVQRRNQKIIEESGDIFLSPQMNLSIIAAAEKLAQISGYAAGAGAGTVEFLYDQVSNTLGFLEMNTRLQVEHPVTDQSLGIDLAKWQILHFDGRTDEIPFEHALRQRFTDKSHAIEARIYAEDPENNYHPVSGTLLELNLPTFNAIRCDFGFSKGDSILPDFDPMLGKIIAKGATRAEAIVRLERALSEFYVKGVTTNTQQLLNILRSPYFQESSYTNSLLSDHPELTEYGVSDSSALQAAVFASVAINLKKNSELARSVLLARDMEGVLHSGEFNPPPEEYVAEAGKLRFHLHLLPITLDNVRVFANNIYYGEIEVLSRIPGYDDYFIRFESRSYHVRLDVRPTYMMLRFPDADGRVNYHRLRLHSQDGKERSDPLGLMRAPFHGSFVKFFPDADADGKELRIGSRVKKDQPLLILSAMKMEATLTAPIDGKITFLLEDGDLTKLQLGVSSSGQIFGKKIDEGEILVHISPEDAVAEVSTTGALNRVAKVVSDGTMENLFEDRFGQLVQADPQAHLPVLLQIVASVFRGMLGNEKIIGKVSAALEDLADSRLLYDAVNFPEHQIVDIISEYCNIKSVFSPRDSEPSWIFRDLHELFAYSTSREHGVTTPYHPSALFSTTMDNLLRPYALVNWSPASGINHSRTEIVLIKLLRAYYASQNFQALIKIIVTLLSGLPKPSKRTVRILRRLIRQEEAERDDSLAELTIHILGAWGVSWREQRQRRAVPRQYISEYREMVKQPLSVFPGIDAASMLREITASLAESQLPLIPEGIPAWARALLAERQQVLKRKFNLVRLFSPLQQVLMFGLQNADDANEKRYLCVALIDKVSIVADAQGRVIASDNMERANFDAAKLFLAYQSVERRQHSWTEIVAAGTAIEMEITGRDPRIPNLETIRRVVDRVVPFFVDDGLEKNIVTIKYLSKTQREAMILHLLIAPALDFEVTLLSEQDPAYPYADASVNQASQALYARNKWPAEFWAERCFDTNSAQELFIPSVDSVTKENLKTGEYAKIPVGSHIFDGTISGKRALLYIKDSRINGGATGNLEGLKYVAACYMAFMLRVPLYVFNDGAGANIREGVVSLNRAGEGFMMNSLVNAETSAQEFFKWLDSHADNSVHKLIAELDKIFSFNREKAETGAFIVAIGVGSSTGLDVYGSSQAAIQCMVDSAESYRVLTGAKVIKSVTGEKVSNYDLGGARIMSVYTGTVDLVAQSNLHLLSIIRQVHEIFAPDEPGGKIPALPAITQPTVQICGLSIADFVDHSEFLEFKEKYHQSFSLIGGFARLGGRKVLIMGPKDDFGIRSAAAVTKACELLRTARKTGASQIFLSGARWYQEMSGQDNIMLRARLDFMRLLQKKSGVRIHILTHPHALDQVSLNANADAVIVVASEDLSDEMQNYVHNSATHVVRTIQEAFVLAHRIIDLLKSTDVDNIPGEGTVRIPENPAEPYDMMTAVIRPVFDKDSFVEFFAGINDRAAGPALLTGLARLSGRAVGVIADQPAIIGGAPDAAGTEKFRVFTELLNQNGIPIIMLSNAPGFVPGKKQEGLRIQQVGGLSLDTNILGEVPVVSVVLNQNFGGRQIQAFSKYLRPGIIYFALRRAVMAVMGAQSAFDLFEGDKYRELLSQDKEIAENFHNEYIRSYNKKASAGVDAMSTGVLDWVFEDPATLRSELIKGIDLAIAEAKRVFGYPG